MDGRENHHRLLVGVNIVDFLVHLEEVSIFFLDICTAFLLHAGLEIEEHGQTLLVDAEAGIATLFGGP